MNRNDAEEAIDVLEERLGNMESRLLRAQCDHDDDRVARITAAMEECENAINIYRQWIKEDAE